MKCNKTRYACSFFLTSIFFNKFIYFYLFIYIYLFLAALGLCCCMRVFSSCSAQGFSLWRLLLLGSMDSRCVGFSSCGSRALERSSVVVAHGFSCSAAWEIFPDQGPNLCSLHWQADS